MPAESIPFVLDFSGLIIHTVVIVFGPWTAEILKNNLSEFSEGEGNQG